MDFYFGEWENGWSPKWNNNSEHPYIFKKNKRKDSEDNFSNVSNPSYTCKDIKEHWLYNYKKLEIEC